MSVAWDDTVRMPFVESLAAVTTNVLIMKNALKGDVVFSVRVTEVAQLTLYVNMDSVYLDADGMQNVL